MLPVYAFNCIMAMHFHMCVVYVLSSLLINS